MLQRLLEYCTPNQLQPIVEVLLEHAQELCRDAFANYVMQHLFEFGVPSCHKVSVEILALNLRTFGTNPYAAAVIAAALVHSSEENRVFLARALIAEEGLVARLALTRKGSLAVKAMQSVLDVNDQTVACKQRATERYARSVARAI